MYGDGWSFCKVYKYWIILHIWNIMLFLNYITIKKKEYLYSMKILEWGPHLMDEKKWKSMLYLESELSP